MFNRQLCCVVFLTLMIVCTAGYAADGEENPSVVADPNSHNFIVVFNGHDNEWNDEECIYARIYYFDNLPHELIFHRIDSTHGGHNVDPDIAINPRNIVVAWTSSDGDDEGIKARVFDLNIYPVTNELAVNSTTAGKQCEPAAALDDKGRFMIVWTSGQAGSRIVKGRLFKVSGSPLTSEFAISTTGDNFTPSVAVDPNGLFSVAWSVQPAGSSQYSVAYRQYNSNGTPRTAVLWVAQNLSGIPAASVDMNQSRDLIIAWNGEQTDIYARLYDPNNNPKTSQLLVNTFQTGKQEKPSVSLSDSGMFVVVWQSENSDGSDYGICGRQYDPNHVPVGQEFPINLYAYRKQHTPDVTMDPNDNFFTVWQYEAEYCWLDGRDYICEYPHAIGYGLGPKPEPTNLSFNGDISGNGYVDLNDLSYFAGQWLKWGGAIGVPQADPYPDGHRDMTDFYIIARDWQSCYQPPYPPELMYYYHLNRLSACSTQLRGLANSIMIYANDNYGDFPPTLQVLMQENYMNDPWPDEMFMCPAVCPHTQSSDYIYRGNDLDDSKPSYMIILYDRQTNHSIGKRNVAFVDGHVQTMTESEFLAAIEQDNAFRRTHPPLQEKPAE
jgi:prepilin-type processing-associated H-X9-DG protein